MATSPRAAVDPSLPALESALDTEALYTTLSRAAGSPRALRYDAHILSHKIGRRCTIRYTPVGRPGADDPRAIIGKLYRSRRQARRMYDRQIELGEIAFDDDGRTRIPAALEFVEELGLVLQAGIDGVDLRHFLEDDSGVAPFELAGAWLARLHSCHPPEGLRYVPVRGRLARLRGWSEMIAPHIPNEQERRLAGAVAAAASRLEASAPSHPVVIHKDFYYANLLWDGSRIWGLDLDEVGVGDAAFDVGHFLAHLVRHAWRSGMGVEAAAEPSRRFLRAYEELRGERAGSATRLYQAYTFVKLAMTEVERRADNWEAATRQLTELGCRELEAYERGSDE